MTNINKYAALEDLTSNELLDALATINMSVEGDRIGISGLPALFLNRRFEFDPSQLTRSLISTLATAPQLEQGVEHIYREVPQAARILEAARKNPIIRSKLLGTNAEPFLASIENQLKRAKFDREKSRAIQSFVTSQDLVNKNLRDSVLKTQAMKDYISTFNQMAKRHKGTSEELNQIVMANLLKKNPEAAKLISESTKDIVSRNEMKPGLARVHGNVDRAKFKNIVRDLQKGYGSSLSEAKDLSQMATQTQEMGKRLGNISYKEVPSKDPRINLKKVQQNLKTQDEEDIMDKTSNLNNLLNKIANINYLLDELTPISEIPKGRLLRTRNLDEEGGVRNYIEEKKSDNLKRRGFKSTKEEEKTEGNNSLIDYIISMDKD